MLDLLNADPAEFNDWALVSLAPWPGAVSVLLVGLAAVALGLSFWGVHAESRARRVAVLTALRVFGVVTAVFLVLQPAIQLRQVTRIRNRVPVLVDVSQSMGLATEPGEPTRLDVAKRFLAAAADDLAALGSSYAFDFFAFDAGARPIGQEEATVRLEATGEATDLLAALREATASVPAERLGGVILVTDGADNARLGRDAETLPEAARELVTALHAPIFAFGVGAGDDFKDVAVAEVIADDFAFVRNTVEVTVVLRATGYGGLGVPVTLKQEGQVLATRQATLGATGEARVTFSFSPKRIGKFIHSVSVPVYDDEAIHDNNVKHFVLKVIRDKIRVLQVCGRPSWDERFLRQLLKENPNIDLISFFILRTPYDDTGVPQEELSLIPFPTRELFTQQLHTFDLVVFQNFSYLPYQMAEYLENIRDFVLRDGGGFVMIGGELAFAPGAYGGTPLEDVLPVDVGFVEGGVRAAATSLRGGPPPGVDPEPFSPRLVEEGRRHPITDLTHGLADNEEAWRAMPALPGINLVRGLKPDATVLLAHPFRQVGAQPAPVVAVREAGRGRSMAVLTDSTWYWKFVVADRGGSPQHYHDFWSNAIRWLIRDPDLTRLRAAPGRETYRPGERVTLEVRGLDTNYRPAEGARAWVEITSPDERVPPVRLEGMTGADGTWVGELKPPAPGPYKVRAGASGSGGEVLGAEETAFVVRAAGRELEDARPGHGLLRALAELSDGEIYTLPRGDLPELALKTSQSVKVNRKRNIEIWTWPWLLVALSVLLGAEWFLRRRWGYL
jgi:uncharacterized membrane protein